MEIIVKGRHEWHEINLQENQKMKQGMNDHTTWLIIDIVYNHAITLDLNFVCAFAIHTPSQHSTQIYIGPSSARQGSWRADDGPM